MKKFTIISIAAIIVMLSQIAHAGVIDMFMTDAAGSYIERQPKKFGWTETPWLAIELLSPTMKAEGDWWWSGAPSTKYTYDTTNPGPNFTLYSDTVYVWVSLTNWHGGIKKTGQWHIDNFYINDERLPGHSINFAVLEPGQIPPTGVPEPGTFLLLGIGILGRGVFKRRTSSCQK